MKHLFLTCKVAFAFFFCADKVRGLKIAHAAKAKNDNFFMLLYFNILYLSNSF